MFPVARFQICVVDFVLGCILKMFMVLHVAVLSVSKYHFECAIVLHVAAFVLKSCFLQADRQTDGRIDGRTDRQTDGQTDGQADLQSLSDVLHIAVFCYIFLHSLTTCVFMSSHS